MRTLVALLVLCATACATTVTGKAVDINGNPYTGTVSAYLYSSGTPISGGKIVNPSLGPLPLAADGSFTITLTGTDTITPAGSVWQFTFCGPSVANLPYNQSQTVCFNSPSLSIAGASFDVTSSIASSALVLGPRITNVGFNASTVTDPYIEGRTQGIDCTGAADSSAGFVAWLLSGEKRKEVPSDCKIKIQASAGHGAIATGIEGLQSQNAGWIDIFGGGTAEIFGCGAGTGAVVNFNRSGYFRFHGFVVQPSDPNLCPGGSTFTRDIDWTNNGGGGVTSTKAQFDHLRLLSNGLPNTLADSGVLFPTLANWGLVANNGSLVTFITATPSWSGVNALTFQQITPTNIVNGTAYSATIQMAISGVQWDSRLLLTGAGTIWISKCTANCTSTNPNGTAGAPVITQLASNTCPINSVNTWIPCTVNYTGTAGDAGSPITVQITNSSAIPSGKFNMPLFDNVTATNITVNNPSFETLVGGATLTANGFLSPAVGTNWNWANWPAFIGLQVGAVSGDQNLEGATFRDIDIDGAFNAGSIGIYDQGCCSEHNTLDNIGMFNIYRGIGGSMPWPMISEMHGGGNEGQNQFNYQVFGIPGGALVFSPQVAGVFTDLSWDGFGPLYNSAKDSNGNVYTTTNNVPVFINPIISGTVHAAGEYDIDISHVANAVFEGGQATNLAGVLMGAALNNPDNAFVGMSDFTGNSCCGDAFGLQTVHLDPNALHGAVIKGAHVLMHGLVANGTATLGTAAIGPGACATVVTVSAPGVNTQQAAGVGSLNDAVNASLQGGPTGTYTTGLVWDKYATTDNVNFTVCNLTAGSLTPPAKTVSWSVVR